MLDVPDRRPVDDILWERDAYLEVYRRAGMGRIEEHLPLGRPDDGIVWVSETAVAPWAIDVVGKAEA
jgi:hypothetical protein